MMVADIYPLVSKSLSLFMRLLRRKCVILKETVDLLCLSSSLINCSHFCILLSLSLP
jgi:hypothetical protein